MDAHNVADSIDLLREWGRTYAVTATHCSVCGQPLTDALSVNRGIGPICSRDLYEVTHEITDSMVMAARGHIVQAPFPHNVRDAMIDIADAGHARDLCNVMLWWASAHLDDTHTVLACAEAVGCLGFESLAAKIRLRNTDVLIEEDGDGYVLRCKTVYGLYQKMDMIAAVTAGPMPRVARKGRYRFGVRFTKAQEPLVWAALGTMFGGRFATVPSPAFKGVSRVQVIHEVLDVVFNTMLRAAAKAASAPVKTVGDFVKVQPDGRLYVYSPYNRDFIDALKSRVRSPGYRWRPSLRCWEISPAWHSTVNELVTAHFLSPGAP